ncbi:uncharacterized protein TNCV_22331 [Trichonephila clavipes]|nr:uncharacterized protein TNCV_22331 [Trichonephila clavipes]
MMGLRRISVILYVIGWTLHTLGVRSDVKVLFYGPSTFARSYTVGFFPMGPSQGTGVSRRSDNTACCLYFDGSRGAATCDGNYFTACSSLPRHARWTI